MKALGVLAALGRSWATMRLMRGSALTFLAIALTAVSLAVPGCGGDEEPKEKKQGDSVECGGLVCNPAVLPQPYPAIEACCAANGKCGLDGAPFEQYGAHFTDPCQPRDQPGELDDECDGSPAVPTEIGDLTVPGCCTPEGRCGYMLNTAFGIIPLGLGCVDAEPFLDGGVPASCTPGPGGGGGAGGGAGQ